MSEAATIYEVADSAGISVRTVSRYLEAKPLGSRRLLIAECGGIACF